MQGVELTPQEKAKFIQKLKLTGGNVSKACQAVKRSRKVMYDHKKTDVDFAALWEEACESVYDEMEQEMYRRAVKGVVKPLVYKGQIVKDENGRPIIIREYSDRLLELGLKSNRPEKFRERLDVNQNISGGLNVDVQAAIKEIYDQSGDIEAGQSGNDSAD